MGRTVYISVTTYSASLRHFVKNVLQIATRNAWFGIEFLNFFFLIIIGARIIHMIIRILINSEIVVLYLTLPTYRRNFADVSRITVKVVQP